MNFLQSRLFKTIFTGIVLVFPISLIITTISLISGKQECGQVATLMLYLINLFCSIVTYIILVYIERCLYYVIPKIYLFSGFIISVLFLFYRCNTLFLVLLLLLAMGFYMLSIFRIRKVAINIKYEEDFEQIV